jgi:DNA repair protein RecN (Recombination protein N)
MLNLLKLKNVALIDQLEIEFGAGLNLLTGETGSGKSIIVDSLGALTGDRISADLIKPGENAARIEGSFTVAPSPALRSIFERSGIENENEQATELIIRRELALSGKNRVFVNDQLVTQSFLKQLGSMLVDIHGQGDQAALYDVRSHIELLDDHAGNEALREKTANAFTAMSSVRAELEDLEKNEAEKLQLLDILKFQVDEISRASLHTGEDKDLEEEKLRLNNVEKLSTLSTEAYSLLYDDVASTIATLEKAARRVAELAGYDSRFGEYSDSLDTARAVIDDLSITLRDFRSHLEFSPQRLEEIETRLAEISRLVRKYGGSIDTVLAHLQDASERIDSIEMSEYREEELRRKLSELRTSYIAAATELHDSRVAAAAKFEKAVEKNLRAVALEKARFEVRLDSPAETDLSGPDVQKAFTPNGFDRVEFFFSANVGEAPRPLVKVASGGEASRLMLVLKTSAKQKHADKTAVFDEIDVGIGGRVAEAVGLKLRSLAEHQQVLCVTHQPQIASLADRHFVVEKTVTGKRTLIGARELSEAEKIDEIARMLAGEKVSETAREHAREMLAGK